jgi:orotate phosphoribosyltransferase-like protein
MPEIQRKIEELEARGWTLAAIARELEVSWDSVHRWKTGRNPPENPKLVDMGLSRLLQRRRIPKRKVYKRNPPATE